MILKLFKFCIQLIINSIDQGNNDFIFILTKVFNLLSCDYDNLFHDFWQITFFVYFILFAPHTSLPQFP